MVWGVSVETDDGHERGKSECYSEGGREDCQSGLALFVFHQITSIATCDELDPPETEIYEEVERHNHVVQHGDSHDLVHVFERHVFVVLAIGIFLHAF